MATKHRKVRVGVTGTTMAQAEKTTSKSEKPARGKDFRHKTEKAGYTPGNYGKTSYSSQLVNIRKTQRNEPCPCGSGKKHKHCHLESKH